MKSFVHIATWIIALGLAGLLTGCAGHSSPRTARRTAHDFEVVETNSKRLLTPQEMEHLRHEVLKFLEKERAVASGDYYVKIFLAPGEDGIATEWVVVRFTRETDLRFELLGSDDSYYTSYRSYAAYDYYPYGYDNFSRISFQYYDDPYYGSRYYYPPRYRHDRHERDNRHDRDRDPDRHVDNPQAPDTPRFKPIPAVGTPRVTRTRGDGDSSGRNNQDNPSHRNHGPRSGDQLVNQSGNPPAPQPAAQPVSQSAQRRDSGGGYATRSELHRSQPAQTERTESTRTATPARSSSPAPSYSPPASRTESSQSKTSETPSRESDRTAFKPSYRD